METPSSALWKSSTSLVGDAKGVEERMLTMKQIYRIKQLYDYEENSMRKIAYEIGNHFLTVKKYAVAQDFKYELKCPKNLREDYTM